MRIQTAKLHVCVAFIREQNAVKRNKNIGELFVVQYYGGHKELFDFNNIAKWIHMIMKEWYYFIMNHATKYVSYFKYNLFYGTNIRIDVMNI